MMSESMGCPHCGGTTNHFSRSRNALICDTCGSIVQTDAERAADVTFERNMALARQHLQVGNWDEAKRLIKPYCSSRPADKQLYLMLLMTVTKGYSDYLISNDTNRREAYDYWDKLTRLNCINETMRNYARKRLKYVYEEKSIIATKKAIAISVSILFSFIAICLLGTGEGDGVFFAILAIGAWIFTGNWIKKLNHTGIFNRDKRTNTNGNPFT